MPKIRSTVLVTALAALFLSSMTSTAQAPMANSPAIDVKARELLGKLTLDEKLTLLGGTNMMFTQAIEAKGIPSLKMSDASAGLRGDLPSTVYAGGVALAATWDREIARKTGESLGKDARARAVHFLLGPGVNIARSPVNGRNFEYLSEDPFLNSALAVPYIEGVQSQGVVATVKHYVLNNSEYDRHNIDVHIDERTLREIYLPAFEAAVKQGQVGSVMNSYNLVNGTHATQHKQLNLDILKGEWGFQGLLMSDWFATYDGVAAMNNGLDLEMPSAAFLNKQALQAAIQKGDVKESTVDEHVLRLLRLMVRFGFLDRPQFAPLAGTYSEANRQVALDGARASLTLLKNDASLLPLDAKKVKTIAVFGPNAFPAVPVGGGSAQAKPFEAVSILAGIAHEAGAGVKVLYARGIPSESELFQKSRWQGPVKAETYSTRDFTGSFLTTEQRSINDWKPVWFFMGEPEPRSIRYTAHFKAEKKGRYLVVVAASGGDAYKVTLDGKPLFEQKKAEGQVPASTAVDLEAGQQVTLVADYLPLAPGLHLGLGMMSADELIAPEVKQYAALADAVVVSVGFTPESEGEGQDRSFALPWGQDELIEAAAAANPKTIVTLTAGGPADARRWIAKVPAFLATWYGGQEAGTAAGEILFGKRNPEGKLPVSFDRSWEENPSYATYGPIPGANSTLHVEQPGVKTTAYTVQHSNYSDGLMVGYRYWTTQGKQPLYPFGFGLSYTTFAFSKLTVPATAKAGSTFEVSFEVKNTGKTAGTEVAQLYLSGPSAKAKRPERELKGFEKIRLNPGESRRVILKLDARAFSYWDELKHDWTIDPGKFLVRVGNSSQNTPLEAAITLN